MPFDKPPYAAAFFFLSQPAFFVSRFLSQNLCVPGDKFWERNAERNLTEAVFFPFFSFRIKTKEKTQGEKKRKKNSLCEISFLPGDKHLTEAVFFPFFFSLCFFFVSKFLSCQVTSISQRLFFSFFFLLVFFLSFWCGRRQACSGRLCASVKRK